MEDWAIALPYRCPRFGSSDNQYSTDSMSCWSRKLDIRLLFSLHWIGRLDPTYSQGAVSIKWGESVVFLIFCRNMGGSDSGTTPTLVETGMWRINVSRKREEKN